MVFPKLFFAVKSKHHATAYHGLTFKDSSSESGISPLETFYCCARQAQVPHQFMPFAYKTKLTRQTPTTTQSNIENGICNLSSGTALAVPKQALLSLTRDRTHTLLEKSIVLAQANAEHLGDELLLAEESIPMENIKVHRLHGAVPSGVCLAA
jgi:hypothetical protein